uniref:Mitochondrial nucleoid associated protein 1 n=1 Tax=Mus spicilegus TaxID=10103 RepID=A0A8C6MU31_MUSSI
MGAAEPQMEVCPYCKKPFKRLKSHLPHCKMRGPSTSADKNVSQSKPAALVQREKRPTRDLTRAKEKELEVDRPKRAVKAETSRASWTAAASPLPEGILGSVRITKAEGENKDQNQFSFQALSQAKPEVTLQRVTTPWSPASDATSPKRELTQDVSESQGSPCPSETEAPSLISSVEPFLANQDRKYSSTQPHANPAISVGLKLGTVDPQRQKLRVKLLDVPLSDRHSPKSGSHGVQRVTPSVLSREKGSQDGGHLLGVSAHPGNTKTQKSESLLLGLHTGLLGKAQVREHQELGLGMELSQSKGNTENRMSVTNVQEGAGLGQGGKDPITATKAKPHAALELRNMFMPESGNQSLTSPAVTSTPEENAQFCGQSHVPAITLSVGSVRDVLEPTSFCQPHTAQAGHCLMSYSAQYPVPKTLVGHVAAVTSGSPPRSVGLEWFPELYPAYVGLGVLPRRPPPWSLAAQVPPLPTLQGRSVSKVPWWGRSSADSRSLEPLALTTSSLPLMRLLGAVHKGWVQCNTTIKKSGVGGLTMLFAGYFILCCNWSFKHLKLQRWRK